VPACRRTCSTGRSQFIFRLPGFEFHSFHFQAIYDKKFRDQPVPFFCQKPAHGGSVRDSMSKKFIAQLLFWLVFFPILFGCNNPTGRPRAVQGVLDLSQWDAARDGLVTLDGEWEFYWNKLLAPDDFKVAAPPEKTGFFPFRATGTAIG